VLLFVLSLCGFSGALATRLFDPLITSIAADFATPVGVVALLSSAFALPFGLSQPFLGPTGDAFGKEVVIKVAVAVLALCQIASAIAADLTLLFISRILGGVVAGGIMPVCMALIGDTFSLAVRQVALSRYIGSTLIGQLVGASVGGMLAEWIGWRGVLGCAAALTVLAAVAALVMMPRNTTRRPGRLNVGEALARYGLVLSSTLAISGVRCAQPWPRIERGSARLEVEDWFCVDDLVSALEGELEAAEVSEGAPAAAYGRPVEELEAVAVGDRTQPGHGGAAAPMAQRVATTAGLHVERLEPGDDLGKEGIGRGHGSHCGRAVRFGKGSRLIRLAAA